MTLNSEAQSPPLASRQAGLRVAVAATADSLQAASLGARGEGQQRHAKAVLARWRRAAGTSASRHPLEFEEMLSSLVIPLHEREIGRSDAPSPSEQAAFDALSLFAIHAQGMNARVHDDSRSFAAAIGLLVKGSSSRSLKTRFDALLTARSHHARLVHIRSLVTLLRGSSIAFDYGALAADLRSLAGPRRQGVLLRWSRDFSLGPVRSQSPTPSTPESNPQ